MKIIIEKIWSKNILLPKASIVQSECCGKYYPAMSSNSFGRYTYRLRLKIIKSD